MTMTVKKLIAELEKIENKFLEVECKAGECFSRYHAVELVKKVNQKVIIFTKEDNE